jgi:hypothetical protein
MEDAYICLEALTSNLRARRNLSWRSTCQYRKEDSSVILERGTNHGQSIETLGISLSLKHQPQLVNLGDVLLGQSTRVTGLRVRSLGREVIVVVLGVEIHGGGLEGFEEE